MVLMNNLNLKTCNLPNPPNPHNANTMCADAVWWRHVAGKHMCAATATMMPSPMK